MARRNNSKPGESPKSSSKNAALLGRAAQHAFGNAVGARYQFPVDLNGKTILNNSTAYQIPGTTDSVKTGFNIGYLDVPGIMSFEALLVPGLSSDGQSPINIAAEQMHNWLKSCITSSLGFDAPDTMMFCLTMDNLYCYYTWMQRLYGIANNYQVLNRYQVDALIQANHVDSTDLIKNKDKLAYYMEQFAVFIRAYSIPTSMPYFKEHADMFAHVYKDGEDDKAQLYMFVPYGFYQFSETSTSNPRGQLTLQYLGAQSSSGQQFSLKTVDDLITLGNSLLQGVRGSDDASMIQAALLKAFGYNSYELSSTPFDYKVVPEYNEEVLMQIHNITVLGRLSSGSSITQNDANDIIFTPALSEPAFRTENTIVDCAWNDPTPEQILKMTRFTGSWYSAGSGSQINGAFGSVIICDSFIAKYFHSSSSYQLGFAQLPYSFLGQMSAVDWKQLMVLSDYEKFDWAPLLYWAYAIGSGDNEAYAGCYIYGDFENFTSFTPNELNNIHQVHLLDMFDVPRTSVK